MFTIAGAVNNIHTYGAQRSEYEIISEGIVGALRQLRQEGVVDYLQESELMETLGEIESGKDVNSKKVTLKLAAKGVRICLPGVGGVVADLVSTTAQRQLDGGVDQEKLLQDTVEAALDVAQKEAKKEVTKAFINGTADLATNIAGVGVATLALANAPVIATTALVGGGLYLAANPQALKTGWNYVTNFAKGAVGLLKEGAHTVLQSKSNNKNIIDSYSLYQEKRVEWIDLKKVKEQKENAREEARSRLNTYESDLTDTEGQLNDRQLSSFGRFVYYVNQPEGLLRVITSLFCLFSNRFKSEKVAQDIITSKMTELTQFIDRENSVLIELAGKINSLAIEIFNLTPIVEEAEEEYLDQLFA